MNGLSVEPCGDGSLPDVKVIGCRRHEDSRGYLTETFKRSDLLDNGIDLELLQANQSYSASSLTIRGLHFQVSPVAQAKLVRVVRGAIFDVAVDVRSGSPTFGAWVSAELTDERLNQLYIPRGFAHGFCTLHPETIVVYAMDGTYSPECERGIAWDDPDIAIDWPLAGASPVLSDRDRGHPRLADLKECGLRDDNA